MSRVPANMVEVSSQGIVSLRGKAAERPLFMLKDELGRSIAIPLSRLESELLQHTLGGDPDNPDSPQPYRNMLSCLDRLDAELGAVHIHYNSEFDLPTHLVLRPRSGQEIEIPSSCCDGIIFSRLKGAPLFVDEELMATIGSQKSDQAEELSSANAIIDSSLEAPEPEKNPDDDLSSPMLF